MKFTTKRDINGNRYTLLIDHNKRTFTRNYNPYCYSDYITITKKDRKNIITDLEKEGYTETNY